MFSQQKLLISFMMADFEKNLWGYFLERQLSVTNNTSSRCRDLRPCSVQVRDPDGVRRRVSGSCDRHGLLDRLLQLHPEPAHLRLLQPGLQRGLQEHSAVRVLQPLQAAAVRPGRPGPAPAQPPVRPQHQVHLLGDLPEAHRPSAQQ